MNKPHEIEIETGFDGKLLFPTGSHTTKVRSKVLYREVIKDEVDKYSKGFNDGFQKALLLLGKLPMGNIYRPEHVIDLLKILKDREDKILNYKK